MPKEKTYYWEKFNPVELFIWRNKKHFGNLLDSQMARPYGSRNSKWRYDYQTGEFVWNQFRQVDKCQWSKEPEVKRMKAERLLRSKRNEYNPIWDEFEKALKEMETYNA